MFRLLITAVFLFSNIALAANPFDWIPPLTAPPPKPGAPPAAAPQPITNATQSPNVAPGSPATIDNSAQMTSPMNRADKKAMLTYQVVGVGPNRAIGYGGAAGVFLTPNLILFADVGSAKASTAIKLFEDEDIIAKNVGLHVKHFVGNSFYYRLGVDYKKIDYEAAFFAIFGPNSQIAFEGKSYALNLSIGNQWQWENFTLGCDWIGISVPFQYKFENEYISSPTAYQNLNAAKDDYVKENSMSFLRFYIGASF